MSDRARVLSSSPRPVARRRFATKLRTRPPVQLPPQARVVIPGSPYRRRILTSVAPVTLPPPVPVPFASDINPAYPVYGTPTTQSVRDNFQAAKDEIEALQNGKLDLAGGALSGDLTVNGRLIAQAPGTWTASRYAQSVIVGAQGNGQGSLTFLSNSSPNTIFSFIRYSATLYLSLMPSLDATTGDTLTDILFINGSGETTFRLPVSFQQPVSAAPNPTLGFHLTNKNYVDGRTPITNDAPNDGNYWYGRHNAAWSIVPGFQTFAGGGSLDLNTIAPATFLGLLQITNQTGGANWPPDNPDQTALILHGWNSNVGWKSQFMMGGRQGGKRPMPALWYRSNDDSYGAGAWSPWQRLMGESGGTFAGQVTFNAYTLANAGLSFGSVLDTSPDNVGAHISLYGGNQYGFGITSARLNYVVPNGSFHAFRVGGAAVAHFNASGLTIDNGDVTLLRDPTALMHAATKQYVDAHSGSSAGVSSFNGRTGAVSLTTADVTTVADATYVNVAGDTMTGNLSAPGVYGSYLNSSGNIDAGNAIQSNNGRIIAYRPDGSPATLTSYVPGFAVAFFCDSSGNMIWNNANSDGSASPGNARMWLGWPGNDLHIGAVYTTGDINCSGNQQIHGSLGILFPGQSAWIRLWWDGNNLGVSIDGSNYNRALAWASLVSDLEDEVQKLAARIATLEARA